MSRPRFLADHDLDEHIVLGVLRREPGVVFTRARDVGIDRRPDPEVLEYAAGQGLIVVSHDTNTMIGHAYDRVTAGLPFTGLFIARQMDPTGPMIDSLLLVWGASEAEEWAGLVRFLPV